MREVPKPSRPPLQVRHWPGWFFIGLIGATHLVLPRRWVIGIGRVLGRLSWSVNWVPRRVADINLRHCLPTLDALDRKRLVQDHFRLMGQAIWDYPLIWFGSARRLRKTIDIEGLDRIQSARAAGRPVILMVAHSVGLDVAPPRLAMEVPMTGPYNPFQNALAEWLISHGRSRFGNQPIPREAGLRGFVKALRGGGVLYYLADEDYGAEKSVFAPLFGQAKATLPIIGRLAVMTGAVVLPTITVFDQRTKRYRVIIDAPLPSLDGLSKEAIATTMNRALEAQIRRDPVQYMWTLRLFKTRPPDEPGWYS